MPRIPRVRGLAELPPPPAGRSGWPWTVATPGPAPPGLPRLSVVTPSYQQGHYLEETIRSVLLQGYPGLEYLIIDGGSTDASPEILRRYAPHLDFWVSEPDAGPADALQKGFARATGEIVAYLNSDDLYLPGCLRTVAQAFAEDPECVGVCGSQRVIDAEGKELRRKQVEVLDHRSLLHLHFVPQPAIFVRRAAFEAAGGIDPKLRSVFDYELWLRLTRLGRFRVLPDLLAATRWHADTITARSLATTARELVEVVRRNVATSDLAPQERRRILHQVHRLAALYLLEPGQRRPAALVHAGHAFRLAAGPRSALAFLWHTLAYALRGRSAIAKQARRA